MLALLGLGSTKTILFAVAAAVIVTLLGGLYFQNRSLRGDLLTSEANGVKLVLALETQREAVAAAMDNAQEWMTAHEALSQRIEELSNVHQEASVESRRLQDIFSRHDLSALALRKPGLIERRIAAGSLDAFRVLNSITSGDFLEPVGLGETGGASPAP